MKEITLKITIEDFAGDSIPEGIIDDLRKDECVNKVELLSPSYEMMDIEPWGQNNTTLSKNLRDPYMTDGDKTLIIQEILARVCERIPEGRG